MFCDESETEETIDSTTDESETEDDASAESDTETTVASTESETAEAYTYEFVYDPSFGSQNFAEALKTCTDNGMTLPIIRHEHQLPLLVEFLKSNSLPHKQTWMHAIADSERNWFWLDSEGNLNENDPVLVSTWETDEPNNSGGIEDYISAHTTDEAKYPSGLKWNDVNGEMHTRYFVCQKKVDSTTDESKTEDDATTESETETAVASTDNEITYVYETSFGKTVFADALQVCTDKGMTLPIIRHEKQLTLLVEFLKSKSLPDTWMHAMAEPEPLADTKRKWFWLDSQGNLNENDPVIVSTWETGEPSNSGGIEVHISAHLTDESKYPSGMKWNDLAGWEHHRYFVCQKETIAMTDDK